MRRIAQANVLTGSCDESLKPMSSPKCATLCRHNRVLFHLFRRMRKLYVPRKPALSMNCLSIQNMLPSTRAIGTNTKTATDSIAEERLHSKQTEPTKFNKSDNSGASGNMLHKVHIDPGHNDWCTSIDIALAHIPCDLLYVRDSDGFPK